ncbi:MAG: hypothetical protein U0694_24380 [Anaerolineae bacterium]
MRALHQVRPHERFVASGIYEPLEDQRAVGIKEHWSLYQLPDDSQIIRVDHDARESVSKTSLLLEALRNADGQIERCDLRLYYPEAHTTREVRATYNFVGSSVEVLRVFNGNETADEVVELPDQRVIYPPAWIFSGRVVEALAAREDNTGQVFTSRIAAQDNAQLLSGSIDAQSACFVRDESITVGTKTYAAHCFQLASQGKQHELLWLDEHKVLIRYSYQDSEHRNWTINLTQYARKL